MNDSYHHLVSAGWGESTVDLRKPRVEGVAMATTALAADLVHHWSSAQRLKLIV